MTSDWLIDLHSANFSNSLQQKITKLEPMNLPRFPSFSVPNPWLESTLQSQVNVGKITDEDFPELGYSDSITQNTLHGNVWRLVGRFSFTTETSH